MENQKWSPFYFIKTIIAGALALLFVSACHRLNGPTDSEKIKLKLTMPPHPSLSAKSVNKFVKLSEPRFCYMIDVHDPQLTASQTSCHPDVALRSAFVAPNDEINLELPKGDGYEFRLYSYLLKENEACATLEPFEQLAASRLFLMGSTSGINIKSDDETVVLDSHFPGLSKNLYQTMHLGSECGEALPTEFSDLSSANANGGIQTGTKYKMILSSNEISSIQSGRKYKVSTEVKNVVQ